MTALEIVRSFAKEHDLKPLASIAKNVYQLDYEERQYKILVTPSRPKQLKVQRSLYSVKGMSLIRLHKICAGFNSDSLSVKLDAYKEEIQFTFTKRIKTADEFSAMLLFLADIICCFIEELKIQGGAGKVSFSLSKDEEKTTSAEKHDEDDVIADADDAIPIPAPTSGFVFQRGSGKGFESVAGFTDLKKQLHRDFIYLLMFPKMAKEFGVNPPNGLLLYGPPGCGKTFLAEKTAEESNMNYIVVKPSDLGSSLLHGSEAKIRQLFNEAEKQSPCLVVFDEFDALVPSRGTRESEYKSEEINEFLVHLNNCADRGVYVMAMTNHPERIDRAVLRKGRIDQCIYVPAPDEETREQIFELELKSRPCSANIDVKELARQTALYSSSDISYVVKQAARRCFEMTIGRSRINRKRIDQKILTDSIASCVPSISAKDIAMYTKMRDELQNKKPNQQERRRIGF